MASMVRIHDRRLPCRREYKADYHKASIPVVICAQCGREAERLDTPCRHCGQRERETAVKGLPDNGALVSCGLSVGYGPDEITPEELAHLINTNQIEEIPQERMGHGGCQSRCVLRGDSCCQW